MFPFRCANALGWATYLLWTSIFSVSAASATEDELDSRTSYRLSVSGPLCVLDDNGVACYGDYEDVPQLGSVDDVYAGQYNVCAFNTSELTCWGDDNSILREIPSDFSRIQSLSIAFDDEYACAVDDNLLRCWGDDSFGPLPQNLIESDSVVLGSGAGCVLDGGTVRCWGNPSLTGVPPLSNPTDLTVADRAFCVIDEVPNGSTVICWGDGSDDVLDVPDLEHPIAIEGYAAGPVCALDQKASGEREMVCWGGFQFSEDVPEDLGEVLQMAPGGGKICALARTSRGAGIRCWDRPGSNNAPDRPVAVRFTDVDGDGLPDAWENVYGLDATDPGDALLDLDGDGVPNSLELDAGTDPGDADNDGITDVWERRHGLSGEDGGDAFSDFDNDSFIALEEYAARTSPADPAQFPGFLLRPLGTRYRIDAGLAGVCVIDDSGVRCIGGVEQVPPLVDPMDIVVGDDRACAIDQTGEGVQLVCWGGFDEIDPDESEAPPRATAVELRYGEGCAVDGTRYGCFVPGSQEFALPADVVNPRKVLVDTFGRCVIDDLGVRCWGTENFAPARVRLPALQNPRIIESTNPVACVIDADDSGTTLTCWGEGFFGAALPILDDAPDLQNPIDLSLQVFGDAACAIEHVDDGEIRCWGGSSARLSPPDDIGTPLQLALGDELWACALAFRNQQTQVVCWGDGAPEIPDDWTFSEQTGFVAVDEFVTLSPGWRWRSLRDGTGQFRYKLGDSDLSVGAVETTATEFAPEADFAEGTYTLYVEEQLEDGSWAFVGSARLVVDRSPPSSSQTINLSVDNYSTDLECEDAGFGKKCDVLVSTDLADELDSFVSIGQSGQVAFEERDTVRFFTRDPLGNSSSVFTVQGQSVSSIEFELTSQAIEQTGTLSADGRIGSGLDGVDLRGFQVVLDIESPGGETVSEALVAETDIFGRFAFDDLQELIRVNGSIPAGTYGFSARFAGTSVLQSAESGRRQVLVGRQAGYAIVLQGRIAGGEGQASHKKTANRVYRTLLDRGFVEDNIHYFAYSDSQDAGVSFETPSLDGLQQAIADVGARMRDAPAPFYLILVDHGTGGLFHVSESETLSPSELDSLLIELEAMAEVAVRSEEKTRAIILGYCYSGEFVEPLAAPGRVVIASATADEESYRGVLEEDGVRVGEYFLEQLFGSLAADQDLLSAFQSATVATERFTQRGQATPRRPPFFDGALQHPLLEDSVLDGVTGSNVLKENYGDGSLASGLFLGVSGGTNTVPLLVTEMTPTRYLAPGESEVTLFASANDNEAVQTSVRIEIREPNLVLREPDANRLNSLQRDVGNPVAQRRTQLTTDPLAPGRLRWEILPQDQISFVDAGKYEVFYSAFDRSSGVSAIGARSVVYKNRADNVAPDAFALVVPGEAARVRTEAVFAWQATVDSDDQDDVFNVTYNLIISTESCEPLGEGCEFSNDPRFNDVKARRGSFFIAEEIDSTTYAVSERAGLIDGQTYQWKVEAVDRFGARRSSEVRTFTTDNSNTFAGPDVMVNQSIADRSVFEGAGMNLLIEAKNLGGAFDGIANAVRTTTLLPNGLTVRNSLPAGCELSDSIVTCLVGDLPARSAATISLPLRASARGLYSITSSVTSYLTAAREREQADDNYQNNVDSLRLLIEADSDRDGDGLPDDVELDLGSNPDDSSDAVLDSDGDGVSNLDEYRQARNPLVDESTSPDDGVVDAGVVLVSSLLPLSRSVEVGSVATAFVTIFNAGTRDGLECGVTNPQVLDADTGLAAEDPPVEFFFATTDSANLEEGARGSVRDIAAGNSQSFVIGMRPTSAFDALQISLSYSCRNSTGASLIPGINTLLLSSSSAPVPDIVALSATSSNDGVVRLGAVDNAGAFAVATVNLGAGGEITASADTGGVDLPVTLLVCATDASSGACLQTPSASVVLEIGEGATPTLAVFAIADQPIGLDAARNRVFVRFRDAGEQLRGSTSVAIAN